MTSPLQVSAGLQAVFQAAYREADERAHWIVTPEIFLLAIVRSDEGKAILAACGADLVEMERELVDYLDLLERGPKRQLKIDTPLDLVLRYAGGVTTSSGKTTLGIDGVLAQYHHLKDAYAQMLITAAGIERVELLRQIEHGTLDVKPVAPEGRWLSVRLYNDDYTPMDLVVRILEQIFHLSPDKAQEMMLAIHAGESAVVVTLDRDDAVDRAMQAYEVVQQAGRPLRITLETAE